MKATLRLLRGSPASDEPSRLQTPEKDLDIDRAGRKRSSEFGLFGSTNVFENGCDVLETNLATLATLESRVDVRKGHRASHLVKRFQEGALASVTFNSDDAAPKRIHKREAAFFHQVQLENQRARSELLAFTHSFLPNMLVEALESGFWSGLQHDTPALRQFSGTIIVVEIVGMFAMTASLLQRLHGEMHLSKVLDRFFTPLIAIVVSYRGDVVQFTGDSLVIFFEGANDHEYFRNVCGSSLCSHTPPELSCLRATACCLELHKHMQSFDIGIIDPSCPPVSVAIGVSTGTVSLIGLSCGPSAVGKNGYLHTVGGLPVRQASYAARIAEKLGEPATVLCPDAWQLVVGIVVEGPELLDHAEFHRLEALDVSKHTYPMVRHAAQLSFMPRINSIKDLDAESVDLRLKMSMHFLHRSVTVAVATGSSGVNDESRKVSLAMLCVSGVDATTNEGLDVLAKLTVSLQEACNTQEGSLWKLIVDDCVITFYFVWGLPPLVHLDDPKRACKACYAMMRVVTEANLSCKAAIVSASMFCGAIGSVKRREYAMMGSAMQVCASITTSVELSLVLVDDATHQACHGDLDFVSLDPIIGGPCLEPISVFQLLPPRSGDCIIDAGANLSSSPKPRLTSKDRPVGTHGAVPWSIKVPRNSPVVFSPPCTPPWLAKPRRNSLALVVDEPLFPTLWTSIWCERPITASSPKPPQVNLIAPDSRPKGPGLTISTDAEPWKAQVPVPLPWPARSMACGGVSPIPAFSSWRVFKEVERHVSQVHEDGGGLLLLVGPFGCGKTEMIEHVVCSATRNKNMLPIFGSMEMRSDHEFSAVRGVLRGALALLEPGGQIKSDEAFRGLISKEVANTQEFAALEYARILPKDANSRSPSLWGEKSPVASPNRSVHFEPSPRPSPNPSPRSSLLAPTLGASNLNSLQDRQSRSGSIVSGVSAISHSTVRSSSKETPHPEGALCLSLIGIAKRLIQKLLESAPVVIILRVSQGTSRAPVDLSSFWRLVHALETMAHAHNPGNHELFIVVVCQAQHLETPIESCYPKASPIFVGPLNQLEVTTYIHLCLGLKEVSNGSEEPSVPPGFAVWLSRIAHVPRYIEEGLTQLHRLEMIEIIDGKCIVKAPLESIRVAAWIHTDMVARVIADAEAISPEQQQVLQVATTLQGPFSTLDLAAANRLCAHRALPPALIMQQCVKKINACIELTKSGILRQVDGDWHEASSGQSAQTCIALPKYVGHDAPSWYIPSALIHQVIAATLFQSHRMELKRAILVTRAIRIEHRRQSCFMSSTSSYAETAQKKNQHKRRTRNLASSVGYLCTQADDRDIPISCLVTPLMEYEEESSSGGLDSEAVDSQPFSHKMSIATACTPLSRAYNERIEPRQVDLVEFLPLRCLRRFSQARICYSLWIAAFGRELTLMCDGPQDVLDVFLLIAALFLLWDSLFLFFKSRSYFRNLYIVSDLLITLVIFTDISWLLGMDDGEFLVLRRQSGTMIRVVFFFGKFVACICRLSDEIQRAANWMYNHPYCRRMADGCVRPLQVLRNDKNIVKSFVEEDDPASTEEDRPTAQLAGIANKVANAVLLTLTVFTVLTTGAIWLVDYNYYPDEDLSMQAWAWLISNYLGNGTNATVGMMSPNLSVEVDLFQDFYEDLSYGPFSLCNGYMAPPSGDLLEVEQRCSNVMWRTLDDQFSQPSRVGYQVDVQSGSLWASFDFSAPAQKEATVRFLLLLTLFVLTFALAVSINIVVTSMVTAPLMRIMTKVREISGKLREQLPGLQDLEEDEDEVLALEEVVGKLVTYVTKFNPDQDEDKNNEWINNQSRKDDRRAQSYAETSIIVSSFRRRSREGTDVDCELLAKMDISLDEVNSWSFNVFRLERFQLEGVTAWLLLRKIDEQFDLHTEVVTNYVRLISDGYHDNPYHCWKHAVDVHHTVHRACDILKVQDFLNPLDLFALAVAAIAHDVGHPGFNNHFLEMSSHELALRYNDKSPLENMHCATMFALMQSRPDANIFQSLRKTKYKEARQTCVDVILHTDNAKHFDMVKELELFHATNSDLFDLRKNLYFPTNEELDLLKLEQNRKLSLNALMHGSDISNACKPWRICTSWADLVLCEFFLQGDEEKRLGIPIFFDRDTVNKPASQVFFIAGFVVPFYTSWVKIFAPLWQLTDCLQANLQIWHLHRNREVEMEEEKRQDANKKISGLLEDLRNLNELAQLRSEHLSLKSDQLLREATKQLQAKTDPFGKLTLEPDIDMKPQLTTPRGKHQDGHGRKKSKEPRRSSQQKLHLNLPRCTGIHSQDQEDTIVPLPGALYSSTGEQALNLPNSVILHHAPAEAGNGPLSPSVSELTSLQPGSNPEIPELSN